jgi:arylsulfate sulfotransferase
VNPLALFAFLPALFPSNDGANVATASVVVTGQNPGATPFIAEIHATVTPANSLKSVQFTISPKPGSVTRPVSATFTTGYLQNRGYLNPQTGALTVPVFGLYANYSNTVSLNFRFTDNSSQQSPVTVVTVDWMDSCGVFKNPTVVQARTHTTSLSYDYWLTKNLCGNQSPTIIDTDGAVRWVGTLGLSTLSSLFFDNAFYIASSPPGSSNPTGFARIEFDGTARFVKDYSSIGVTATNHHNYDPGKYGMLIEVNTTSQTESVIVEVDGLGNVIKTWNLADTISAAMTAGGDDPTQFVQPAPTDWFHNNAATYRKSDDTLIVSSRENFVIGIDYENNAIRWILGDPTKKWYQFPSLRKYALTLGANTLPPIGQHAVSITKDDRLLLFDDGLASMHQTPAGASRSYSAPRKYRIDTQAMVATEEWNYPAGQTLYSPICSSVYEDAALNYLIDYAVLGFGSPNVTAALIGLDAGGNKIFDYRYTTSPCGTAWNSIPIHFESLLFGNINPVGAISRKVHGSAGTFDIDLPLTGTPGVECRSGPSGNYRMIISFAVPVTFTSASVDPGTGGTAQLATAPTISGNQVTVNLTNVSNAQTVRVNLTGVSDGINSGDVHVLMGVLIGDVNGSGVVTSGDSNLCKAQALQPVTSANFRCDVNASGAITTGDLNIIKQNALLRLSSPP